MVDFTVQLMEPRFSTLLAIFTRHTLNSFLSSYYPGLRMIQSQNLVLQCCICNKCTLRYCWLAFNFCSFFSCIFSHAANSLTVVRTRNRGHSKSYVNTNKSLLQNHAWMILQRDLRKFQQITLDVPMVDNEKYCNHECLSLQIEFGAF